MSDRLLSDPAFQSLFPSFDFQIAVEDNRFIADRHPLEKRVIKDGIAYCKDVFDKFVLADQSVTLGERVIRSYSPARRHQRRIILNVYSADSDDVQVNWFDYLWNKKEIA